MLRVLTLSTLFPDATRPNFGIFVERQTLGLAAHPGVELRVVAPVGLPPWPMTLHPRYRALAGLPGEEEWKGLHVSRPRFAAMPGTRGRFHAAALARALVPLLDGMRRGFAFDVIDASFFFPDGPAAVALGRRYGVPVSIKARGADVHFWGTQRATARQVRDAGLAADGLLAVSAAMAADMAALGLPRARVHHTGVDLDRFAPVDRAVAKAGLASILPGTGRGTAEGGGAGSPRGARLRPTPSTGCAGPPPRAGEDFAGPLVVAVGALIPRKGHDIVIDAVARLPGVRLLIAGEGPERAQLSAGIARLGVCDRVRLIGSVPHGALPALLAAADVMALASSSEGLANAWVEALACGTPIVIPDAGGAREVVTGADAGRIVAREPGAFAAAIGELLAAPPAQAAVRRHAERFTWAANSAALYDHLAGLVSAVRS